MHTSRILVIDDDPSWQELLTETIEAADATLRGNLMLQVARSYEEADALLDRQHFHLAFVDLRLREEERELTGKKLAQKIAGLDEGTSVVIATGHADVSTAITALREWNVLDFVLKDEWDPDKVVQLVQTGLARARQAYSRKYESSLDLLRGAQGIYEWSADVLRVLAPSVQAERPDRLLADFLNELLNDLHPLLPPYQAPGLHLDSASGSAVAEFWSKALGRPISVCISRRAEAGCGIAGDQGFNWTERVLEEEQLGLMGCVITPRVPPFTAYRLPIVMEAYA